MNPVVYDADAMSQTHELSPETKTVILRKCWSVVFDVNGNAPADKVVASFATEDLADKALILFAAQKDDDAEVSITIGGERSYQLPTPTVEGYGSDTWYVVREDWQEDNQILLNLAGLATLADCAEPTDLPDGVTLSTAEDEAEDSDDED